MTADTYLGKPKSKWRKIRSMVCENRTLVVHAVEFGSSRALCYRESPSGWAEIDKPVSCSKCIARLKLIVI